MLLVLTQVHKCDNKGMPLHVCVLQNFPWAATMLLADASILQDMALCECGCIVVS